MDGSPTYDQHVLIYAIRQFMETEHCSHLSEIGAWIPQWHLK
jgi:hypothetical protein